MKNLFKMKKVQPEYGIPRDNHHGYTLANVTKEIRFFFKMLIYKKHTLYIRFSANSQTKAI